MDCFDCLTIYSTIMIQLAFWKSVQMWTTETKENLVCFKTQIHFRGFCWFVFFFKLKLNLNWWPEVHSRAETKLLQSQSNLNEQKNELAWPSSSQRLVEINEEIQVDIKAIVLYSVSLKPRLKNTQQPNSFEFASESHWENVCLLWRHWVLVTLHLCASYFIDIFLLALISEVNHKLIQKCYIHFCASYRYSNEYDGAVQRHI